MDKDLANSMVARKNILNNQYALSHLESHLQLGGLLFEGETVFLKQEVAQLLDIDERTVERYLSEFNAELSENGYQVLTGQALKNPHFVYVNDINVVNIKSE